MLSNSQQESCFMPSLLRQMLFEKLPKAPKNGRLVKPYRETPQELLCYGSLPEKILQCLKLEKFPVTSRYVAEKIGVSSRILIVQLNRLVQDGLVDAIRQDRFNEYVLSEGGKTVTG